MNVDERLAILREAQRQVNAAIDYAATEMKGAQEFRDAVEALLADTPFRRPDGYDHEGLYGRLRNALAAWRSPGGA